MGKKKGKRSRSRGRKGRKGRKSVGSSKVSAAVGAGALITAATIVMDANALQYAVSNPNIQGMKVAGLRLKIGAMKPTSYIPLAAGLLIHWGKNKPVLNIVGRPLNQLSKKVLKRPL